MSVAKKRFVSVLAMLLSLLMLASCQPGKTDIPDVTETTLTDTTTPVTTTPAPVLPEGIVLAGQAQNTVCTVTYPASNAQLKEAAESLAAYVNALIPDAGLTVVADSETVGTEYTVAVCAPDAALSDSYSVKLDGKRIALCGRSADAVLDAVNYFKSICMTDGYLVVGDALSFASGAGPKVLEQYPEKYYYYEDIYTPALAYTFEEDAVDTAKSRLLVGGVDVTAKAVWDKGIVSLTDYTVEAGDHTVLLALSGTDGNVKVFETTFSCGDGSVMHLYKGEVHAHTADSDGEKTVKEAYAYARDIAGLDYFAVTDHSDSFSNTIYQKIHQPNADSYNDPGKFAALYGYEQTYNIGTGYYGHLNTLNRSSLTSRSLPLRQFYTLMAKDDDAVVMFNHPGYTWGNFVEYAYYTPEIDAVLNLAEIKSTSAANYEYALALTKGWHIGPVYNEDNHDPNWGTANEHVGYVLAPALTRQNVIDAFNKNRTYTTSDSTLKIYYQINGEWMGARLDNPDTLQVKVQLSTEKPQGLGVVSIIAEDGITVATQVIGPKKEYTWELDLPPHYDYYYVKVESGSYWCYTSPIWIENREQLTVGELSQELVINNSDNNDHRIHVPIANNSGEVMTGVTVEFYLGATAGFNVTKVKPSQTVTVGDIAPGATVTVHADLKYSAASPRVYAVVKGTQNGKDYGAVRYMEISTLYFSEILPLTARGGADAYEFIELYNNSDATLDLAKYTMRYYSKAGAKAADLEANTWKLSGKIRPHSTLVIWMVPATSKLTVADFNARFGTNLVEGRDIVRLTGANIPHDKPVQLELLTGSTVIGRAWYNWSGSVDALPDRAVIYNYPTDYTMTAKVEKARNEPTPGTLAEGQMPNTVSK